MLRAAIGGVREIERRGDELRLARPDCDGHRSVAGQEGRVAFEDERGLVDLRVRVDDHEPAHLVTRDDVHDALVGEGRHDEVGQRTERLAGLERARELLADRRQQSESPAPAPLGVVHARAFERVGALLAHRHCELARVVVET